MGIQGSSLYGQNFRLRFFLLMFMGIMAFASVLYWRSKTPENAQYVDTTSPKTHTESTKSELRSTNYQLDVQDTTPSVK